MRLHERFRLTLSGNLSDYASRSTLNDAFFQHIDQILRGDEFDAELLRSWGITLSVEPVFEFSPEIERRGMCTLYRMRGSVAEVARTFNAQFSNDFTWQEHIFPRYTAPIVLATHSERRLGAMRWGFPVDVQGKTKRLRRDVVNARNLDSPVWRRVLKRQRCLVPFTQFAEPKPGKDEEGRPAQHWFSVPSQPIAAFAGLWRQTPDGPVFAFCTCAPNPLVEPLHPKAMPAILHPEDYQTWLSGEPEEAMRLVAPYPSQLMAVE